MRREKTLMLGETKGISRETGMVMGISKGETTRITAIGVDLEEFITARAVTKTILEKTVRES